MSTRTIKTCDYCDAEQPPNDSRTWGVLTIKARDLSNDVCPVCIELLRYDSRGMRRDRKGAA